MSRLQIDIQRGFIEVEGERDLVESVYRDFKDIILPKFQDSNYTAVVESSGLQAKDGSKSKPKQVRRRKGGPSCASKITILKEEDFFAEPRSPSEVKEKLAERAATYESKHVAAALADLIKSSRLRRFKKDGSFMYQNP